MLADTILSLAAATGRRVASITIAAGGDNRVISARGCLVSWAGGGAEAPSRPVTGVIRRDWTAWPRSLLPLPALALDELHLAALAAAWRLGAWDVTIYTWLPADIARIYGSADEIDGVATLDDTGEIGASIGHAAKTLGLREWTFRPIAAGPVLRRSVDATLTADGTRPPEAMPTRLPPSPSIAGNRQIILTLGRKP